MDLQHTGKMLKKSAFAMVRQLGIPTWFMSLSCGDTRWSDLLVSLANLVDGATVTAEDTANMSWATKSRLIKSDPVTVSRFFNNRVERFISAFLKNSLHPLGEVTDFFYRVEFQQRGSPHIHAILWIQDAPQLERDSNEDVVHFIDDFITTSTDIDEDLVKLQRHRHTHTCKKNHKNHKNACRFNFPLPPMRKTQVLEPLPLQDREVHKANWKKVKQYLQTMEEKQQPDETYDSFLASVGINEDAYINAIRSSLTHTKIFLKRDPADTRINGYNKHVLKAWDANCDIQFVINAFACIMYIVSYMSKAEKGRVNYLEMLAMRLKREEVTYVNKSK